MVSPKQITGGRNSVQAGLREKCILKEKSARWFQLQPFALSLRLSALLSSLFPLSQAIGTPGAPSGGKSPLAQKCHLPKSLNRPPQLRGCSHLPKPMGGDGEGCWRRNGALCLDPRKGAANRGDSGSKQHAAAPTPNLCETYPDHGPGTGFGLLSLSSVC